MTGVSPLDDFARAAYRVAAGYRATVRGARTAFLAYAALLSGENRAMRAIVEAERRRSRVG